jgi:thiamine biosynthesis lipoprotein
MISVANNAYTIKGAQCLLRSFFLCALIAAGCGAPSPADNESGLKNATLEGETMGTRYMVKTLYDPDPEKRAAELARTQEALDAVSRALDEVDATMSTYQENSEVSRFNRIGNTGVPIKVSENTYQVFQAAVQVSEQTGGAFDVTVGPLVNAWGFGPVDTGGAIPNDEQVAAIRKRVGYQHLIFDKELLALSKGQNGLYCDLSAIAKGFGVDQVARALDDLGYADYMVEVGGEVRAKGVNKRGVPWQIAIERPTGTREAQRIVPLSGWSLATSGDYRNYREKDGVRLSHTVDPRTGRPIAHKLASVSVLHKECMWADAYATALMVLGSDEGLAFAQAQGLAAYFIVREDDGSYSELSTPEFEAICNADG